MTVKELKEELENLPDNMEIVIQCDAKGRSTPLLGLDPNAVFIHDNHCAWSGDVYYLDYTADDYCLDENEWADIKYQTRSLVLHPAMY